MIVERVTDYMGGVKKYRLVAVDGADLPVWTARAHLNIVLAPEFL